MVHPQARAGFLGALASLLCHGLAAVALWQLPGFPVRAVDAVDVDLTWAEGAGGPAGDARRVAHAPAPVPGGAHAVQNVDARSAGGRGDARGAANVILLVERADDITLQDSPMTAVGVAEAQRIRTAPDRATAEPRRATPNPADEPYLASGTGGHAERRDPARTDARAGALSAPDPSPRGGPEPPDRAPPPDTELAQTTPLDVADADPRALGTPQPSPGLGIVGGTGRRDGRAARVAHGRPPVDQGRAATPAIAHDARVRDNRNSELLATQAVQSWVQASERSGPDVGDGRGGTEGGGLPGVAGLRIAGGRSRAYGPGHGSFPALDTRSSRYQEWELDVRRRVTGALVFPRERMLRMDQGTSVYRVVVHRDGTLAERPELLRSSRFDDLDAAALRAIERSAPFEPVPAELGGRGHLFALTIPIEFSNPMVR